LILRGGRMGLARLRLLICRLRLWHLRAAVHILSHHIGHSIYRSAAAGTTQALRNKKTMSAIRRMVPSKPPMYIWIPPILSESSSEHAESQPVGALSHIASGNPASFPHATRLLAQTARQRTDAKFANLHQKNRASEAVKI
jgi:hypothetical protein